LDEAAKVARILALLKCELAVTLSDLCLLSPKAEGSGVKSNLPDEHGLVETLLMQSQFADVNPTFFVHLIIFSSSCVIYNLIRLGFPQITFLQRTQYVSVERWKTSAYVW